jgi:hypothetical protein
VIAALLAAPLALVVRAQNPPAATRPSSTAAGDAATSGSAGSATDASTEPLPTFRADINFVRVDVIVSDKQGNPVHDLRQEDFEVTEDGKPQVIQTFKLVNVTENTGVVSDPPRQIRSEIDEQTEAARDDVRLFAVFLDDYHVRLENSMRTARSPGTVRREPARPCGHGRHHVSALVDQRRDADARPAFDGRGDPLAYGTEVQLRAEEPVRRALRPLRVDHGGRAHSK